jgi:hypothetical protein
MSAIHNSGASTVGGMRRTTRASSRAASSRGPSPAIDEQDIPATPSSRRTSSRRATSTQPLPQVGLRTSSAYGTNQISQAASMRAPSGQENITSALGNILEPLREEEDSGSSSMFLCFNVSSFANNIPRSWRSKPWCSLQRTWCRDTWSSWPWSRGTFYRQL